MNRIDEMNQLIDEITTIPQTLEMNRIKTKTKRRARIHYAMVTLRGFAIALIAFMGTLVVGVNTSPAFASYIMQIPILRELGKSVLLDKGVEEAVENGFGTEVDWICKGDRYPLYVDYVAADDTALVLFFHTDDDGGKTEFSMSADVFDGETGESIATTYYLPRYSSDGKDAILRIDWDQYYEKVRMELQAEYDDGIETYSLEFDTPEKSEAKIYTPNETFSAGQAEYRISEVRIYPLSTEIDMEYINPEEVETLWMSMTIYDEAGHQYQERESGTIIYGGDDNKHTWSLDSGYYELDGQIHLKIDSVETLEKAREIVTLDLNTMTFSDIYGPVPELSKAEFEGKNQYRFKILDQMERSFNNTFNRFLDKDGEWKQLAQGGTQDSTCIILKNEDDIYIDGNNQITLERAFPDQNIDINVDILLNP